VIEKGGFFMTFFNYPYRPYLTWYDQSTHFRPLRQEEVDYPEINPEQLKQSAATFQELMDDAQTIIDAFANSKEFCYKVMAAAQKSDKRKVEQYIKGTGINRPVSISYNPDGINLTFSAATNDVECCKLSIALHW
jgi:hypothetical protein